MKSLDPTKDEHLNLLDKFFETQLSNILINELNLVKYSDIKLILIGLDLLKKLAVANQPSTLQLIDLHILDLFTELMKINCNE